MSKIAFMLCVAGLMLAIDRSHAMAADDSYRLGDEVKFRLGTDFLFGTVVGFQNGDRTLEIEVVQGGEKKKYLRNIRIVQPAVDKPEEPKPVKTSDIPADMPPSVPMPELTLMAAGSTIVIRDMESSQPVDPDPTPISIELTSFEKMSLPKASLLATWSPPLLVDGARKRLVYSLTTKENDRPQTSITLIDLASKASKTVGRFPSVAIQLLSADPINGRAIATTDLAQPGDGGALVWISGIASGKPFLDLYWQRPRDDAGNPLKIRLAFLTPASIAILQCGDQLVAWDLIQRRQLWLLKGNQTLAAITAGGRYLAAQVGDVVGVLDVATGKQIGSLKLKNRFPAGLAFAPESARLAVSHLSHLQVVDLQDWSMQSELDMRIEPQNAYAVSAWLDEQNLMLAGGLVVRPEDHWVIWNYDIGTSRVDRFETLAYGFYSSFYRVGHSTTLIATTLPHAPVQHLVSNQATPGNRPDLALRPGDGVSIRIDDGNVPLNPELLRDAIERIVVRSGWIVAEHAKVEMFVKISRVKEREVEYQRMGNSNQIDKVKFAPWQTSLELRKDGETIWQRSFTTSTPMFVISVNESFQDRIRRMERPDVKSFDRITLRPFMTGTQSDTGYGTSKFSADGITNEVGVDAAAL